VLIDGNNMEPGLRDRLVSALTDAGATDAADGREPVAVAADGAGGATADGVGGLVDAAEVMTTDTHIVNSVEADNQVGAAIDHDELEALVTDLVGEALADREPVSAGMAVEQAEVTVFGNDRTETLASHANVAVSMGGAFAATIILSALAVSVLVLFLAP
jgi:putative membrane protein